MDLVISPGQEQKLRQYLGFPPEVVPPIRSILGIRPAPEVALFLGLDFATLTLTLRPPSLAAPPAGGSGIRFDEWGIGSRAAPSEAGFDRLEVVTAPLAGARLGDLHTYPWPQPDHLSRTAGLQAEARRLYEGTGLALVGMFGGPILEMAIGLRGADQWRRDVEENPDFACALLNRVVTVQAALDEAGLRAAGRYLSILQIEETALDPGDPLWPLAWDQTLLPALQRRWQAARQALKRFAPQARLMFLAGRRLRCSLPDLLAARIDLAGPVQAGEAARDQSSLKRKAAGRIGLYGGADASEILPYGSEGDVQRHIRNCLKRWAPGGGYILAPTHAVPADAPPENLVALCETVKVFGRYPIS
jgi:uroporphyrinogen decarboxylase